MGKRQMNWIGQFAMGAGVALGATIAAPALAKPLSAEAMWEMQRLGDPALSPDGKSAVLAVSTWDVAKNKRSADVWLVSTVKPGDARQLTSDPANESDPQFSPNGQWIAFTARRDGDEATQIYVLPTAGGEAKRITAAPTGVGSIKWMPDSSGVAFVSNVWADLKTWEEQAKRLKERADSKMTAKVWDKAPVTYWDEWTDDRQSHIYIAPLDGGAPKAVTFGSGAGPYAVNLGPDPYDISPDGKEFAFAADSDKTGIAQNLDVFTINADGTGLKNWTGSNKADDSEPSYSPDGRHLAFRQQRILGFYGDKQRVMLVDRRGGNVRELNANWDRSADGLVWAQDSRSLFGAIDDASVRRVYRIDIAGAGAATAITKGHDLAGLDTVGAGRDQVLVGLRQTFSEPATLVRIDPRSGAETKLTTFNDARLASADFGKVESVTYQGAGGKDIQMWVIKPPNFDPTKKYPLFLLLHGGPHNAITNAWTYRWNAQVFAGWGYVVAWHNFHGSSGFGQAFTDAINPNRADKPYEDTIKAAEWFKGQPYIDANRMVAGGGSYGGYLATTLLGRDHPFRALIAHAAVYNNYTQIASDFGAEKNRHFQYWEKPEEFQRYSPHMAAANFKTPTLVIHGQLDYRVPVNHGIELFNTLQTRGVASKFVYYPNENHWVLQPQNSLFWYKTVREWVETYAPPGGK
jgi:dipeptidyl aminopeptidase/acylaminoacyl peptidase